MVVRTRSQTQQARDAGTHPDPPELPGRARPKSKKMPEEHWDDVRDRGQLTYQKKAVSTAWVRIYVAEWWNSGRPALPTKSDKKIFFRSAVSAWDKWFHDVMKTGSSSSTTGSADITNADRQRWRELHDKVFHYLYFYRYEKLMPKDIKAPVMTLMSCEQAWRESFEE